MSNLNNARVLVVDDDPVFRELLLCFLEDANYQVDTVINGFQAVESYRVNPADLVIMDIVMPDKEGLETIIELRKKYPEVKIIAISGGGSHGPEDYLDSARLLGVKFTFAKPFEMTDLLESVKELIGPK